jgi:hypothetical protein
MTSFPGCDSVLLGQTSLLACLTLADEGTTINQKCQEPLSQQQSITYPEDTNVRNSYLATKFLLNHAGFVVMQKSGYRTFSKLLEALSPSLPFLSSRLSPPIG